MNGTRIQSCDLEGAHTLECGGALSWVPVDVTEEGRVVDEVELCLCKVHEAALIRVEMPKS